MIKDYAADIQMGMAVVTPNDAFIVLQELFSEILTVHSNNLKIIGSKMIESDERIKDVL